MIRALIESVAGYPGLFLLCLASGILLPVPEDIALLYAGSRIDNGEMQWGWALLAALVGVFGRDLVAYGSGRLIGDWLLARPTVVRLFGRRKLDRARELVERRGASAVLAGRFLIGLRAPVFLVAGAMGVPLRKFLLWNVLGLLVTVPGVVVLGFVFGTPLAEGAWFVVRHLRGAFVVTVLTLTAIAWWRWRVAPTRGRGDPDDLAVPADGSDELSK